MKVDVVGKTKILTAMCRHAVYILNGSGKPDLAADIAGARLKLAGALGPGGFVLMHGTDHIAAAHKRGHFVQQLGAGLLLRFSVAPQPLQV